MERSPDAYRPRDYHAPDLQALVDELYESSDAEVFELLGKILEIVRGEHETG